MKKGLKVNAYCGLVIFVAFIERIWAMYVGNYEWLIWAEKTIMLCAAIGAVAVFIELVKAWTEAIDHELKKAGEKFRRRSKAQRA